MGEGNPVFKFNCFALGVRSSPRGELRSASGHQGRKIVLTGPRLLLASAESAGDVDRLGYWQLRQAASEGARLQSRKGSQSREHLRDTGIKSGGK